MVITMATEEMTERVMMAAFVALCGSVRGVLDASWSDARAF
jgi:hypothetical protein